MSLLKPLCGRLSTKKLKKDEKTKENFIENGKNSKIPQKSANAKILSDGDRRRSSSFSRFSLLLPFGVSVCDKISGKNFIERLTVVKQFQIQTETSKKGFLFQSFSGIF